MINREMRYLCVELGWLRSKEVILESIFNVEKQFDSTIIWSFPISLPKIMQELVHIYHELLPLYLNEIRVTDELRVLSNYIHVFGLI